MNINLIAAIGKNYELGKDNKLIWTLKGDMDFFKRITIGHPIVMGRKTYESLPNVLPDRQNIVISSRDINNKRIEVYRSIMDFLFEYNKHEEDVFVIGGATIYEQFINIADSIYLTEIDAEEKGADTFFPKFNQDYWNREIIMKQEENGINFTNVLYKKK